MGFAPAFHTMITADGVGLLPVVDVKGLVVWVGQCAVDDANGQVLTSENLVVVGVDKLNLPLILVGTSVVRHFYCEPEWIGFVGMEVFICGRVKYVGHAERLEVLGMFATGIETVGNDWFDELGDGLPMTGFA